MIYQKTVSTISAASILVAALGLSGCATNPDNITAAYVSPIQYDGYSCPQLREEAARLSSKASEMVGVQKSKADGDSVAMGVGLIIFWPSLFFLKGDGTTATEVAHLKGQMNAVEEASIKRKGNIQFQKEPAKAAT